MSDYRDRRGQAINQLEYDVLRKLKTYEQVADHSIGGWRVTTRWMGYGDRPFATYVHPPKDDRWALRFDLPNRDYGSESAALAGHKRTVALIAAVHNDGGQPSIDRIHAALDGVPDEPLEVAINATNRRKRNW